MTHHNTIYIYGKNPLREALKNTPGAVVRVFRGGEADDKDLNALIHLHEIPVKPLTRETEFPGIEKGVNHQGFVAEVNLGNVMRSYEAFSKELSVTPNTALVILGEIQDPQNVGAIIRSAAAFGVSGILFPEHNQVHLTSTVAKVSAGMAFRVPLVAIGNVNTTIRDLKERGFWIYGMDETAPKRLHEEVFDAPAVFVLGNEGTGIREKTREACDILLSIPMHPRAESLNVAASGTTMLYAWSSQHPGALKVD